MSIILTAELLAEILPRNRQPGAWVDPLNDAMARFAIDTAARAAAFIAQTGHESAQFNRLEENLNYSAQGLMKTWPKRFPSQALAEEYARNPEKIANAVYAGRLGNADAASGDGWRFRGRGLVQITGRANYREAGAALGLPLEAQPELLSQPGPAALSAAHFWQGHGLNPLADDGGEAAFETITRKINGGLNGLAERKALWEVAKRVLGVG